MQKALVTKRSRNNAGRSREDSHAGRLLVDANTTGNFNANKKQFESSKGAYESYGQWNKDERKNGLQFPEISQGT